MESNGKSAAALERDAEQRRAALTATLDELRQSMSPGQVVDQLLDYAKQSGGGDFLRNLGSQVRTNPLPVALIGSGIAWLMMSRGQGGSGASSWSGGAHWSDTGRFGAGDGRVDTGDMTGQIGRSARDATRGVQASLSGAAERTSGAVSGAAAGASAMAARGANTVQRGLHSAQEATSSAANRVADMASSMGASVSEGVSAASETMHHARSRIQDAGQTMVQSGYASGASLLQVAKEQPLLLAALGVAIGAAIGASMPRTQVEDTYVGPTSDAVKDEAQEVAKRQFASAKEAVSTTLDDIKSEAKRQGLTTGSASELVEKAGAVAETAVKSANRQTDKLAQSVSADAGKAASSAKPAEQKPNTPPGAPGKTG